MTTLVCKSLVPKESFWKLYITWTYCPPSFILQTVLDLFFIQIIQELNFNCLLFLFFLNGVIFESWIWSIKLRVRNIEMRQAAYYFSNELSLKSDCAFSPSNWEVAVLAPAGCLNPELKYSVVLLSCEVCKWHNSSNTLFTLSMKVTHIFVVQPSSWSPATAVWSEAYWSTLLFDIGISFASPSGAW